MVVVVERRLVGILVIHDPSHIVFEQRRLDCRERPNDIEKAGCEAVVKAGSLVFSGAVRDRCKSGTETIRCLRIPFSRVATISTNTVF